MKCCKISTLAGLCLLLGAAPLHALKTDRQQPLDVKADSTDGTLGDGMTTLKGNIEIRQGTLLVRSDVASVSKAEGRVTHIELTGDPVHLEQEIENEGLVTAQAGIIEYEVATGMVTLTGAADVVHPQYRISGEKLIYDMNVQHFMGAGGEDNGRIQIRLDPELLQDAELPVGEGKAKDGDSEPESAPENGESG
jgi:lipopolysaccharide export system protein LptA